MLTDSHLKSAKLGQSSLRSLCISASQLSSLYILRLATVHPWKFTTWPQYLPPQVVFTLHSSFANPTRELSEPPYEVTEHGWGEFEIVVEVILHPTECRLCMISWSPTRDRHAKTSGPYLSSFKTFLIPSLSNERSTVKIVAWQKSVHWLQLIHVICGQGADFLSLRCNRQQKLCSYSSQMSHGSRQCSWSTS